MKGRDVGVFLALGVEISGILYFPTEFAWDCVSGQFRVSNLIQYLLKEEMRS